jgi:hypothetical protein
MVTYPSANHAQYCLTVHSQRCSDDFCRIGTKLVNIKLRKEIGPKNGWMQTEVHNIVTANLALQRL